MMLHALGLAAIPDLIPVAKMHVQGAQRLQQCSKSCKIKMGLERVGHDYVTVRIIMIRNNHPAKLVDRLPDNIDCVSLKILHILLECRKAGECWVTFRTHCRCGMINPAAYCF